MLHVAAVLLMMAGPAEPPDEPAPPPRVQAGVQAGAQPAAPPKPALRPHEILQSSEGPGLKVFFFPTPLIGGWARLFQEGDETNPLTHRLWPLARLETTVPYTLEGTRLAPGNYALLMVPARNGQPMWIEVRRVPQGEFMNPSGMPVPAGATVARLVGKTTPTSSVSEAFVVTARRRAGGGAVLTFHYGEVQGTMDLLP